MENVTGRAKGGKATAATMTAEERKARSVAMVEARREKGELPRVINKRVPIVLGDISIPCAVIKNEKTGEVKRVLTENGVLTAIYGKSGMASGAAKRGREKAINDGAAPMPIFLSPERLKPLISLNSDAAALLVKIEYLDGGEIVAGYDAGLLPVACEIWLQAREQGILQTQQLGRAKKAEILMRALAHVGIVALVDEATGYQDAREKDALAKILEKFVAKELQAWVKTFPIEYYKELCRLYGVPFPPERNNQFPQFFGHVTNNAIYSRLAPELLPELKKGASKLQKKAKLHQFLTSDIGHPKLREHLASIVTLLKLSQSKEQFFEMVDRIHPKFDDNYTLDFEDSK